MPSGYASLSKRPAKLNLKEADAGLRAVNGSVQQVAPGKHARLHLVASDFSSAPEAGHTSIGKTAEPDHGGYFAFKRCFDIIGASLAVVILSPALLTIVVYSWISGTSGGSIFFRHRRVGRSGKVFYCLKFRTMVRNADEVLQALLNSDHGLRAEWERDHKLKDDPRVTPFGRFLRRSSLDELPQLWNVLRGDMSLVGPRPVVPDELLRYGRKAEFYLAARPGITGLWQVSGRNNNCYRRRVAIDVYYVRARSITLDFYILLKTLPAVFATDGAY